MLHMDKVQLINDFFKMVLTPIFWTQNILSNEWNHKPRLFTITAEKHFLTKRTTPPELDQWEPVLLRECWGRTLDWTSALWSFWRSSAADFVSSFRAAMCRAGRRTLPLVSFSRSMETTWLWPCWRAMASGVKPSWRRDTFISTANSSSSSSRLQWSQQSLQPPLYVWWQILARLL